MDRNQQKDQFVVAYIRAVAAVAGYTLYKPEVDDDSVDWGIAARAGLRRSTMKAAIRDMAVLRAIRPLEVAAYLNLNGWKEERLLADRAAIWTRGQDGEEGYEVLLPLRHDLGDFAARMSEALETLEVVEQRSQLEILSDLMITNMDVVRFRIANLEVQEGTIPLEEGVRLVERARDLVLAAACAAVAPRRAYRTRKPTRAIEYLRAVRMGQTERGSYVMTILSPVPPELASNGDPLLFPSLEDPFERQVTRTLAGSLDMTRMAAERAASTGDLAPFLDGVREGVSANLCEALADIGAGGLEVDFSWSRTRAAQNGVPRRVVIPSDAIPVIKEAGRVFWETAVEEDVEIEGPVIRLDRAAGALSGMVTTMGFVNGRPRKISLELAGQDYDLAIEAHRQEVPLLCTGELVREGRNLFLKNPRHLSIEVDL